MFELQFQPKSQDGLHFLWAFFACIPDHYNVYLHDFTQTEELTWENCALQCILHLHYNHSISHDLQRAKYR